MAKFIKGFDLNNCIENLLRDATTQLWIISPYIKLHHRYKDCLKSHFDKDRLEIILVFGKNEGEMQKSLPKEEIDFFMNFPNIEIRYEKRLHAKFYANDSCSILTSMNLYDYSQDNNIEAGILMESSLNPFRSVGNLDSQSMEYFDEVIKNSELLLKKEPQYVSGRLGIGKKFEKSIITINKIDSLVRYKAEVIKPIKITKGICIRCGVDIPLKPTVPYCKECYNIWKKANDKNHQEKYCHICGDVTRTSLNFPACNNCYRKEKRNLEFPTNKS
jgi:hypothetical protein